MKFKQLFTENVSLAKKTIFYHGHSHAITDWSILQFGKGNDQNGPGIYFTDNIDEAAMYGPFIYKANLNVKKLITDKKRVNIQQIITMVKLSPEWKDEETGNWTDYGETKTEAIKEIIELYKDKTEKDAFEYIWHDFYRGKEKEYVNNMAKLGFDGSFVERTAYSQHVVIFNHNCIKVLEEIKK